MADTLVIGGVTYNNVTGFKAQDSEDNWVTYEKGGGTNYLDYVTHIGFRENSYPSTIVDLTLPNATSLADLLYVTRDSKYTSVTVTFTNKVTTLLELVSEYIGDNWNLQSLTLNGDTSKVTRWNDVVKRTHVLTEVKGTPLDFSSCTNDNWSIWCAGTNPALEYVRYAENTLKVNHTIDAAALTDASLVSIANGLQAVAKTLTLNATSTAKLSTIMGTVTNNGTYDVFTADA